MELEQIKETINNIINEIHKVFVGKENLVKLTVATLMVEGHLLIEGVPGTGKTLLAKALAKTIGGAYKRIQGHPDILPSDVIGFHVYKLDGSKEYIPGPVMTNILLFDELNRTPTRSQSALLEPMQEYQTTIDGITYKLPRPFMVIATEVPIAYGLGVYKVIETLMDRFAIKVRSWYNPPEEEREIIEVSDYIVDVPVERIITLDEVKAITKEISKIVTVDENIIHYISNLLDYLRNHEAVLYGPSHRAAVHLYRLSRLYAILDNRDYVIPDDVKSLAVNTIAHRIYLREEYVAEGLRGEDLVREALNRVPVPK